MTNVVAIILAAGAGRRMGKPKWQVLYRGESFLNIILRSLFLAGIREIICVVSPDSVPEESSSVQLAFNYTPDKGMFSSVYEGLRVATPAAGCLLFPVDHPFVSVNTLHSLIDAFSAHHESVVRPVFEGKSGHPIIIPQMVANKIQTPEYAGGLRQFLKDQTVSYHNVLVQDPGVLSNINSPDGLTRILRKLSTSSSLRKSL